MTAALLLIASVQLPAAGSPQCCSVMKSHTKSPAKLSALRGAISFETVPVGEVIATSSSPRFATVTASRSTTCSSTAMQSVPSLPGLQPATSTACEMLRPGAAVLLALPASSTGPWVSTMSCEATVDHPLAIATSLEAFSSPNPKDRE